MKKLFLFILIIISVNSFSQTAEKFMKLQRVFSVDGSSIKAVENPITTAYSATVPNNVIWIIKNINFGTNYWTDNPNNYTLRYNDPLYVYVNSSIVEISKPTTFGDRLSITTPLILSSSNTLKFKAISGSMGGTGYYPFNVFFTIEEYVVE